MEKNVKEKFNLTSSHGFIFSAIACSGISPEEIKNITGWGGHTLRQFRYEMKKLTPHIDEMSFTDTQKEILKKVAEVRSPEEIREKLGLSEEDWKKEIKAFKTRFEVKEMFDEIKEVEKELFLKEKMRKKDDFE